MDKKFKAAVLVAWLVIAIVALLSQPVKAQTITIYVCNGSISAPNLYIVDELTAVPTLVGAMGPTTRYCSSLDFDNSGTLWTILNTQDSPTLGFTYTVEPSTGAATQVAQLDASGGFRPYTDISFRPSDGVLFAHRNGDRHIFTVNPNTGNITDIGGVGVLGNGNALAFSSSNVLYFADQIGLYTINQGTGAASLISAYSGATCAGGKGINAMDFAPDGTLWGSYNCVTSKELVTIDIATAALTNVGTIGIDSDGLAILEGEPLAPPSDALTIAAWFASAIIILVILSILADHTLGVGSPETRELFLLAAVVFAMFFVLAFFFLVVL